MNGLFEAITSRDSRTENGMVTHSTSSNPVLDLFYKMGGWTKETSESEIIRVFSKAYAHDRLLATKALFYNRNIRGGQGRRRTFRVIYNWLSNVDPKIAVANLDNIPFYGRWDDVFSTLGTKAEDDALRLVIEGLERGDKLCAKWMPRENKSLGVIAKYLAKKFGLTPSQYRKMVAGQTKVLENDMCRGNWGRINYNQVPSVAMKKYRDAFYKHDESRFSKWIESLDKPESGNKIHADAIYPHDIVNGYLGGGSYGTLASTSVPNAVLEAQWKALPNYVGSDKRILPVVDVSGSMGMYGGVAIRVAVALGIYISERNNGVFKNGFITFASSPELQILEGNLLQRLTQLTTSNWNTSTDLVKVFKLVLSKAVQNNVPASEMPTDILILSDMQFNQACGYSALDAIDILYSQAGYNMPNIIFWNLRTSNGVPAKKNDKGVALVSGYSPSIMMSLLGDEMSPMDVMLHTLNSDMYARVK